MPSNTFAAILNTRQNSIGFNSVEPKIAIICRAFLSSQQCQQQLCNSAEVSKQCGSLQGASPNVTASVALDQGQICLENIRCIPPFNEIQIGQIYQKGVSNYIFSRFKSSVLWLTALPHKPDQTSNQLARNRHYYFVNGKQQFSSMLRKMLIQKGFFTVQN